MECTVARRWMSCGMIEPAGKGVTEPPSPSHMSSPPPCAASASDFAPDSAGLRHRNFHLRSAGWIRLRGPNAISGPEPCIPTAGHHANGRSKRSLRTRAERKGACLTLVRITPLCLVLVRAAPCKSRDRPAFDLPHVHPRSSTHLAEPKKLRTQGVCEDILTVCFEFLP